MEPSISTAKGARGIQREYSGGGSSNAPHAQYDDTLPEGVDPEGRWRAASSDRYRRIGSTTAERAGIPGYRPGYGRSSNKNATGGAGSLTPQAKWDTNFTPQLGQQMQQQRAGGAGTNAPAATPSTTPALPVLPPASGVAFPPPINNMHGEITNSSGAGGTVQLQQMPHEAAAPLTFNKATDDANQRAALNRNLQESMPMDLTQPRPPVAPRADPYQTRPIQQTDGSQSSVRQVTGLPAGQTASASFVPGQNSPANLALRDMKNLPNTAVQQAAKGGKKVSGLPSSFTPSDPLV